MRGADGKVRRPLSLLLVLLGGWGGILAEELPGPPMVLGITVSGNREVREEEIRRLLTAEVGKPFDTRVMDRDFLALWGYGAAVEKPSRFIDVSITPVAVEGGVFLQYAVRERPLVGAVKWDYTPEEGHALSPRHYDAAKGLVRKLFDERAVAAAVEQIRKEYRDRGFSGTEVDWRVEPAEKEDPEYPAKVVVTFLITEGEQHVVKGLLFEGMTVARYPEMLDQVDEVEGNRRGATRQLLRKVVVLDTDRAGWWEYRWEMARFFIGQLRSLGFLDAVVEPVGLAPLAPGFKQYRVVFNVKEGPRYRLGAVGFEGNENVDTEELLDIVEELGFRFYSPAVTRRMSKEIQGRYSKDGRVFTGVAAEPDFAPGYLVNVVFRIKEDKVRRVARIEPRGNAVTRSHVIRREFVLEPGDVYDEERVRRSAQKVLALGLFDQVQPRPFPVGEDQVDVMFDLKERRTGTVSAALTYGEPMGLVGQFSLKFDNFDITNPRGKFRGGGQRLAIDYSAGSEYDLKSVSFQERYFLGEPITFTFKAYDKRSRLADEYSEDIEGVEFSWGWRKGLDVFSNRYLTLGLSLSRFDEIISGISDGVPLDSPIRDFEGRWTHVVTGLSFGFDSVDYYLAPTSGVKADAYVRFNLSALGGDWEYMRYGLDIKGFVPLDPNAPVKRRPVMALSFNVGRSTPFSDGGVIPVYDRFYAGGEWKDWKVRGYEYRTLSPRYPEPDGDPVGGNFGLAASAEVRFPLIPEVLLGVVFFDAGNVWPDMGDFDARDIRTSTGFGLRFMPNPAFPFPIAFYWAWPLDPGEYDDLTGRFIFSLGVFY